MATPCKNLHAVMHELLSELEDADELDADAGRPRASAVPLPAPVRSKAFAAAVAEGRLVDVCLGIRRGANVGHAGYHGRTPLHKAVGTSALPKGMRLNLINVLVASGAEPTVPDEYGNTALHIAAREGVSDVIKMLLAAGADPAAENRRSEVALDLTSDESSRAMLRSALGRDGGGAVFPETLPDGVTARELLRVGVKDSDEPAVKRALSHGATACAINDLDDDGYSCLHVACAHGFAGVAELLIGRNAEVDVRSSQEDTPLHYATFAGHTSIVEMLLAHGADPTARNSEGVSPMEIATEDDALAGIKDLLSRQVQRRREAAAAAASSDDEDDDDEDEDEDDEGNDDSTAPEPSSASRTAKRRGGRQPRAKGAGRGGSGRSKRARLANKEPDAAGAVGEVCEVPLVVDDSINAAVQELHEAVRGGAVATVRRVLANGTPLDMPDVLGRFALHVCAQYSNVDVARVLVEANADINAAGPRRSTPLHLAAAAGKSDVVEFLLTAGAKRNLVNAAGLTAAEVAKDSAVESVFAEVPERSRRGVANDSGRSDLMRSVSRPVSVDWTQLGYSRSGTTPIEGFSFDEFDSVEVAPLPGEERFSVRIHEDLPGVSSEIAIAASEKPPPA